jgi:hypothetical protein
MHIYRRKSLIIPELHSVSKKCYRREGFFPTPSPMLCLTLVTKENAFMTSAFFDRWAHEMFSSSIHERRSRFRHTSKQLCSRMGLEPTIQTHFFKNAETTTSAARRENVLQLCPPCNKGIFREQQSDSGISINWNPTWNRQEAPPAEQMSYAFVMCATKALAERKDRI